MTRSILYFTALLSLLLGAAFAAPVAVSDAYSMNEDTVLSPTAGVFINDAFATDISGVVGDGGESDGRASGESGVSDAGAGCSRPWVHEKLYPRYGADGKGDVSIPDGDDGGIGCGVHQSPISPGFDRDGDDSQYADGEWRYGLANGDLYYGEFAGSGGAAASNRHRGG